MSKKLTQTEIKEIVLIFNEQRKKNPYISDTDICEVIRKKYNKKSSNSIKFHLRKLGLTGKQLKKDKKKNKYNNSISEIGCLAYHSIKLKENLELAELVKKWVALKG